MLRQLGRVESHALYSPLDWEHRKTQQEQVQTSAPALTYDMVRFLKGPLLRRKMSPRTQYPAFSTPAPFGRSPDPTRGSLVRFRELIINDLLLDSTE